MMKSLLINFTDKTPAINFNHSTGIFEIKGRSITENAVDFYDQVLAWLDMYSEAPAASTVVNIQLEYFNTESSKRLLEVLKRLETLYKKGKEVEVNWHYEPGDEDMLEAGEDYQSIIKVPFNLVVMH